MFSGCGIAGCLYLDRPPTDPTPDARDVAHMTDALARRGPHGHRIWKDPGITLGHVGAASRGAPTCIEAAARAG